jgi:sugar lactone lactonase YvrE
MWETIHQDGANNIWVAAAGRGPDQTRLDVFSPDGRFLGSVAAPFSPAIHFTIVGDHLTIVDGDENDVPRVRIFHIDRHGH